MTLAEWKDAASIAKDVIVAIAAVVAAVTAIYGINSWRRETRGKAGFESARALMLAAYRVRSEMANCRSPLIVGGEFPPEWDPHSGTPEERFKSYAHVYSNRWAPVREALVAFDAAVLDAEVLLGQSVSKPVEDLRKCAREVFISIEMYLSDLRSGRNELDKDFRASLRQQMHSGGSDDKFGTKIKDAVAAIEAIAKPHVQSAR